MKDFIKTGRRLWLKLKVEECRVRHISASQFKLDSRSRIEALIQVFRYTWKSLV